MTFFLCIKFKLCVAFVVRGALFPISVLDIEVSNMQSKEKNMQLVILKIFSRCCTKQSLTAFIFQFSFLDFKFIDCPFKRAFNGLKKFSKFSNNLLTNNIK